MGVSAGNRQGLGRKDSRFRFRDRNAYLDPDFNGLLLRKEQQEAGNDKDCLEDYADMVGLCRVIDWMGSR